MAINQPESILDKLPEYGGAGGSQQAAEYYAGQDFYKIFGRNPTPSELAMLSAAYVSGDPNIANTSGGKSAVAQYYQSQVNNPANLAAQQQKQYEANAPKYYDEVNQLFNQYLGRDATDAEKSHFGSLRASGNVDAYTIGQFLSALPETVSKQDKAFRDNLNTDLQKQDAQYYNEQVLPSIRQSFLQNGRSLDSSGYAAMLAKAAQQQNRDRESFLNNLSVDQYRNSQGLSQDAYRNAYSNYQGLQDYSLKRSNDLMDATTGRVNELQNYAIQKQAYDDYLRRYGKRSNGQGIGSLIGGISGAIIGGVATKNPAGASAGYSIGSGVGGGAGSFFQ